MAWLLRLGVRAGVSVEEKQACLVRRRWGNGCLGSERVGRPSLTSEVLLLPLGAPRMPGPAMLRTKPPPPPPQAEGRDPPQGRKGGPGGAVVKSGQICPVVRRTIRADPPDDIAQHRRREADGSEATNGTRGGEEAPNRTFLNGKKKREKAWTSDVRGLTGSPTDSSRGWSAGGGR